MQLLDAGRDLAEMIDVEEPLARPARRAHLSGEESVDAFEVSAEADEVRVTCLELEQAGADAAAGKRVSAVRAPVAPGREQRALVHDSMLRGRSEERRVGKVGASRRA